MATELPGDELATATISHDDKRGVTTQFEAFVREARDQFREVFAPNENPHATLHLAVTVEDRTASRD